MIAPGRQAGIGARTRGPDHDIAAAGRGGPFRARRQIDKSHAPARAQLEIALFNSRKGLVAVDDEDQFRLLQAGLQAETGGTHAVEARDAPALAGALQQHAIAALNLTQQAKQLAIGGDDGEPTANTALIDGVRKFAMDVRELDIDLIDRINPFGEAYAILAKAMSEESLKQVAAAISAKRTTLTPDDAKDLAVRAVQFKRERGRVPALDAQDAWERRMAEGAATFMRYMKEGRYE